MAAEELQQDDSYDTIDEILTPQADESDLIAARDAARSEVEFDDTEGTVAVAGDLPAVEDADDNVDSPAAEDETESPDDAYPAGEDDATASGDGPEQDAQDEPQFDAALLQAAGLEESEARSQFGTPEALENALRLADFNAVRWAQQNMPAAEDFNQLPAQGAQQQPQPPQQQQPPVQPDAQSGLDDEIEIELPELPDGGEWDDESIAIAQTVAQALGDTFRKQLDAERQRLQSQLDEQRQVTQAWLQERADENLVNYAAEFDGFVDGLGNEWKDVFGDGPGRDLFQAAQSNQNSPQAQLLRNRLHLDTVSKQLEAGLEAQGRPALTRAALLERALQVAFPENQQKAIKEQITKQVSDRARLKTARPGNTVKRKELSPEDAATARAAKWYADRGLQADAMDDLEYSEI